MVGLITCAGQVYAQTEAADTTPATTTAAPAIKKDQPIDISSDKLDVFQNDHKAIFTGNVIAIQGTTNMRSEKMTVYYRDDSKPNASSASAPAEASAAPAKNKASSGAQAQGITRIDAEGNVLFTTPTETARGDLAIYHADTDTIDLTGTSVILTRDQNVLKGTKMVYNMATGRSVLTSNGTEVSGSSSSVKPARVHGLFVPKSDNKTDAKPGDKATK
jgi:lipopolysaccharide export system protein LptA